MTERRIIEPGCGPGNSTSRVAPGALRALPTLLLTLGLLCGCGQSNDAVATGTVWGVVEQVLHHGTVPEEGGSDRTITPVVGGLVVARSGDGESIDSVRTDPAGRFEFRLRPGDWTIELVGPVSPEEDRVPTTLPEPRRVVLETAASLEISLRYDLYAP